MPSHKAANGESFVRNGKKGLNITWILKMGKNHLDILNVLAREKSQKQISSDFPSILFEKFLYKLQPFTFLPAMSYFVVSIHWIRLHLVCLCRGLRARAYLSIAWVEASVRWVFGSEHIGRSTCYVAAAAPNLGTFSVTALPPSLPLCPIWSHFASSTDSEEELARSVSPFVVCLLHSTHAWPLFSARQMFQFKPTIAPRVASSCLHIFDQPHPRYILIITTCQGH